MTSERVKDYNTDATGICRSLDGKKIIHRYCDAHSLQNALLLGSLKRGVGEATCRSAQRCKTAARG